MTDGSMNASKLFEQAVGRLDSERELHGHAGLPMDRSHASNLSFVEACLSDGDDHDLPTRFAETDLGSIIDSNFRAEAARQAVVQEHNTTMAYLVGVTERDLDASSLTLPAQILEYIDNGDALTTVLAAGDPNTGKTNTMSVLIELATAYYDDLVVISNVRSWDLTDIAVTSAHDLAVALLENVDKPTAVVVDEGSTHFDARTYRREVANQWSPLHKRMSKIGVELVGVIGHTGKDIAPEAKRLTSLAFYKTDQQTVDFYENWPADSDHPDEQLFGGSLENLEATAATYDPDDAAPWSWNLRGGLFEKDLDWPDLLVELRKLGPADD